MKQLKLLVILSSLLVFANCFTHPASQALFNELKSKPGSSLWEFLSLLLVPSDSSSDIATHQLSGKLTLNGVVLSNTLLRLSDTTSAATREGNRVTTETRTDKDGNFTLFLREGKKLLKSVSETGELKGVFTIEIKPGGSEPIIVIVPGFAYGLQNIVLSSTTNAFPASAPVNVTEIGTTGTSTSFSFSYSTSAFTFTNGAPINAITPTLSNSVTSCTSTPILPTGLSLNSRTCVITGTPTVNQSATNYAITALSSVGTATATISITVNQNPPSSLLFANSPFLFTQNSAIPVQTPSVTGTVTSCSASPSLPSGLGINNTTCALSGTPTATQGATTYTITALNSFGSTTANISITVNLSAPSALTYIASSYTLTVGILMTTLIPTVTGTVTSCSSSPSLPSGMVLNNTTCAISGTPTTSQSSTTYTITAFNSGGSTTVNISFTINDQAPSGLTYSGSPYTFTQNVAISTLTPAVSGTVTSCNVSPILPAGLGINNTTCAISGTPTSIQSATVYTITASNSGGNTFSSISIEITFAEALATPSFNPPNGFHSNTPITITISTSTSGASLYYTTDGSTPTTSSKLYTEPIHIWFLAGRTVKAISFKSGFANSPVATLSGTFSYAPLKSGQITVYATGDNGSIQSGVTRSYTDNGDGTVTDNATGLIWQKCSRGQTNDATCSGIATITAWSNAEPYCSSLNLASKIWRLPNRLELESLPDYGKFINPALNSTVFPSTVSDYYFSSTDYKFNSGFAWNVDFHDGIVYYYNKINTAFVRCVSGQTNEYSKNFTDNGDGTIKDNVSGLFWQKCSIGLSGNNCEIGATNALNWDNAITSCNSLNFASRSWRLPTIKELQTLIDTTRTNAPTIDLTVFPGSEFIQPYWSSTTYSTNNLTSNAWVITLLDGFVVKTSKSSLHFARCVSEP